jgi:hypothetical protein
MLHAGIVLKLSLRASSSVVLSATVTEASFRASTDRANASDQRARLGYIDSILF